MANHDAVDIRIKSFFPSCIFRTSSPDFYYIPKVIELKNLISKRARHVHVEPRLNSFKSKHPYPSLSSADSLMPKNFVDSF